MQLSCSHCHHPLAFDKESVAPCVCPQCGATLPRSDVTIATGESKPPLETDPKTLLPQWFGRYRVNAEIGRGNFAMVYRAHDEDLRRDVAVKVLLRKLLASEKVLSAFLEEARILASLEHPGIVPIHDIGHTNERDYYLVTKFVEGSDLKALLKASRTKTADAVEIVARVAEALHYAHQHGLVHRDVKPANILIDRAQHPLLVDFGLALREQDFGTGPTDVGTPLYMSPEQARKEGHRVDARTDIYSLGVIFYELLVGRHPFRGSTLAELREFICNQEAIPPREIESAIPEELERIWHKAVASRASDRYTSAQEFADDLRHWQAFGATNEVTSASVASDGSVTVAPRGLRSFDAADANFFLELLPGPYNRDGLPESVQFWKTRLESSDPKQAFRVGLLYGPSGCGKSSLIKAGILPHLGNHVLPLFVEASSDLTEARILHGLRPLCQDLPPQLGLAELLGTIRKGRGIPPGKKLVLVIDQFEQWLQASRTPAQEELIEALRQCDGVRLQCLILVRDDFWLAVSRFFRTLEVTLQEGRNAALVDLFDPTHARKVLVEFGLAFGRLPTPSSSCSPEQNLFLDQAVAGLAEQNKIVPVRLALFVEMVKDKPWIPETLQRMGGVQAMSEVFLEENLGAKAPASRRHHWKAAVAILEALLPQADASLKGHVRTHEDLALISGYRQHSDAFEELLSILDQDLRLISPVEDASNHPPNSSVAANGASTNAPAVCYQLSHDYLVPALRQWLSSLRRGTYRGRAELRLAERSAEWYLRPSSGRLPSWWEWIDILVWTRRADWRESQRAMMRSARRYHGIRTAVVFLGILLVGMCFWEVQRVMVEDRAKANAERLVAQIQNFHSSHLQRFRAEIEQDRRWTIPALHALIDNPATSPEDRLHAQLVLLPFDENAAASLKEALFDCDPTEFAEIRTALLPYQDRFTPEFWQLFDDPRAKSETRFRAACALAGFDPENPRWAQAAAEVFVLLIDQNAFFIGRWLESLRPVRFFLLSPLIQSFHDRERPGLQVVAAQALVEYDDRVDVLTELVLDATPRQYEIFWPWILRHRSLVLDRMETEVEMAGDEDDDLFVARQAHALITAYRLGDQDILWPHLASPKDPGLRAYLIHLIGPLGIDPVALIRRYEQQPKLAECRALLLALGEYPNDPFTANERSAFIERLRRGFRENSDPGLHSAYEWLLRHWGHDPALSLGEGGPEQAPRPGDRYWFNDRHRNTFVAIPGPVEFLMGSPEDEVGRFAEEFRHRVRIPRSFALATKETTREQFLRFQPRFETSFRLDSDPQACICGVSWLDAVGYCRWLSEQEGIPEEQMCYPPLDKIQEAMILPADYLDRTGYRLPTEAEWEFACRADSLTGRFFGNCPNLASSYGWLGRNSKDRNHPVGLLKPNDFGLFDVYGNAWEWCTDPFTHFPRVIDNQLTIDGNRPVTSPDGLRALRGGSFGSVDSYLRSSTRRGAKTVERYQNFSGFRVARTIRQEKK